MKKLIPSRIALLYPLLLAILLVTSSYLPTTLSQGPAAAGTWASPHGHSPKFGVSVDGPSHAAANQTHLMSSATLSNGFQQIVLVDPSKQTIGVYHVDPDKGDIQLKSIRKIDADFALEEFNLSEPSPTTIRKNLRLSDR